MADSSGDSSFDLREQRSFRKVRTMLRYLKMMIRKDEPFGLKKKVFQFLVIKLISGLKQRVERLRGVGSSLKPGIRCCALKVLGTRHYLWIVMSQETTQCCDRSPTKFLGGQW